jgi:hypothetical protein
MSLVSNSYIQARSTQLTPQGLSHAAFSLKNEMRNAEDLDRQWATRVPTGHLVNCLQRALMFEECLAQLDEVSLPYA